jgi:ATP-dependent DNA helicase Q1
VQIKDVVAQLEPLQALHASLIADRRALETRLSSSRANPKTASSKGHTIDYQSSSFPWSSAVSTTLKTTFGLPAFRLCQEGVVNAAMDDRDIVCVMPTGGGKSLTYQLPAVMGGKGVTVVISPLLALIWDQVRALKEFGVECAVSSHLHS